MTNQKIEMPEFASIEDEREFWDTHNLTDIVPRSQWTVVRKKRPATTFSIRLDGAVQEMIRSIAEARGVGPTELTRSWILERLRIEVEAGELAEMSGLLPEPLERTIRRSIVERSLSSEILGQIVEAAMNEVLAYVDMRLEPEDFGISDTGVA
jgi:hypothetical protein